MQQTVKQTVAAVAAAAVDIVGQPTTALDRVVQLRSLSEALFIEMLRYAARPPKEQFARIEYIRKLGTLPPVIIDLAHGFRKATNEILHPPTIPATEEHVQAGLRLIEAIARFYGIESLPTPAKAAVGVGAQSTASVVEQGEHLLELGGRISARAVVLTLGADGAGPALTLEVIVGPGAEPVHMALELQQPWASLPAWPLCSLWLHEVKVLKKDVLGADDQSLVVLHPDVVLNVRDVAACYAEGTGNIALGFGSQLKPREVKADIVAGNLGSDAFARLIEKPTAQTDEILDAVCNAQAAELGMLAEAEGGRARQKVQGQLPWLRQIAEYAHSRPAEAESFYIAERLGLQGKLDALVRLEGEGELVFELKTGKPLNPRFDRSDWAVRFGVPTTTARPDHYVQSACYAMIVSEIAPDAQVQARILYAGSEDPSARRPRVIVTSSLKADIISTRNALVAAEYRLVSGEPVFPPALAIPRHESKFNADKYKLAEEFAAMSTRVAQGAGSDHEEWLMALAQHTYREVWADRLGSVSDGEEEPGFCALWRDPDLEGKVSRGEAYWQLAPVVEGRSDADRVYKFRLADPQVPSAEFRAGDFVLMYPHNGAKAYPTSGRILKGRFVGRDSADPRVLAVELNEFRASEYLAKHATWVMGQDQLESGAARQLGVLWRAHAAGGEWQRLLRGERPPKPPEGRGPKDNTAESLAEWVATAPEYFLVQGPPGTGKTRRFIPSLVKARLAADSRPLLIVAFTNRAVEEIRDALRESFGVQAGLDPWADTGLASGEVRARLAVTKCFVMTVHKAVRRIDWLVERGIQAVIVDEASQLVDASLLGILHPRIPFVLIGDHRQLPPIVRDQRPARIGPRSGVVGSEGGEELIVPQSMFERLLERAEGERWCGATAMLELQWRMHQDVQDYPSRTAYQGRLSAAQERQRVASAPLRIVGGLPEVLTSHRVLLIDSPHQQDDAPRTNSTQARLAAKFAAAVVAASNRGELRFDSTRALVGIIAPFRAQCATIRQALQSYGAGDDVLVDTVERFQGSERHIVIVSLTAKSASEARRSQSVSRDGLVDRKLHVAITRARELVVILGCVAVMREQPLTSAYLSYLEERGAVISASTLDRWVAS